MAYKWHFMMRTSARCQSSNFEPRLFQKLQPSNLKAKMTIGKEGKKGQIASFWRT